MSAVTTLKRTLRSSRTIFKINSLYKARKLKRDLLLLQESYAAKIAANPRQYSENSAIAAFRSRVYQLNPKFEPKAHRRLRVFWIGANRDQDESGFLQALRSLCDVVVYRNWKNTYGQWYWDDRGTVAVYDPRIISRNDQCLVTQVEQAHAGKAIDLLLGQTWANYISIQAIQRVRQLGIPFVNISMDDRLPDNWKTIRGAKLGAHGLAPMTDLILTTLREVCPWYGYLGCPAIFWPLASDRNIYYRSPDSARDIDVLFIGNKYGAREAIVRGLEARGVAVRCYGGGWPNGYATAEQSAELAKRAKIILGVGTVGYCSDVYTMKLRDFDSLMTGAMYITHRNPDLLDLFTEGVHIECYGSVDECASKIKLYLADHTRRVAVAQQGLELASTSYTWEAHLAKTLRKIGLVSKT